MTTILLVDDNALQAATRKAILEKRFQNVVRAHGAAEALCLVEQPGFSSALGLVISEHRMPEIAGPEFVAELRSRLPHLPILVLSGLADAAKDYDGLDVAFSVKPVQPAELIAMAEALQTGANRLREQQQHRQLA